MVKKKASERAHPPHPKSGVQGPRGRGRLAAIESGPVR